MKIILVCFFFISVVHAQSISMSVKKGKAKLGSDSWSTADGQTTLNHDDLVSAEEGSIIVFCKGSQVISMKGPFSGMNTAKLKKKFSSTTPHVSSTTSVLFGKGLEKEATKNSGSSSRGSGNEEKLFNIDLQDSSWVISDTLILSLNSAYPVVTKYNQLVGKEILQDLSYPAVLSQLKSGWYEWKFNAQIAKPGSPKLDILGLIPFYIPTAEEKKEIQNTLTALKIEVLALDEELYQIMFNDYINSLKLYGAKP